MDYHQIRKLIKEYLKENLEVQIKTERETWTNNHRVEVKIILDGDEVSTSSSDLPNHRRDGG